jgi:threonine dehydrogenase-like Zn-dependent dehydrogenase
MSERRILLREEPVPIPSRGEALIQVEAVGICGADISWWKTPKHTLVSPDIPGHEFVGRVVQMPPGEWGIHAGDRVTADPMRTCGACDDCTSGYPNRCASTQLMGRGLCTGACAQYICVPAESLYKIDEDVDSADAALAEPLAVSLHMLSNVEVEDGQELNIAIFGAGLQGIFCLAQAKMLGIQKVACVDVDEWRLNFARKMGADLVVNAQHEDPVFRLREWTNKQGISVGIESARPGITRTQLFHSMRKGGQVMLLGQYQSNEESYFGLIVRNELRVQGNYGYTRLNFARAVDLINSRSFSVREFIRWMPFSMSPKAFEAASSPDEGYLKIMLRMAESSAALAA